MSKSSTSSTLLPATDNYSYYKFIKPPTDIGMKDSGKSIATNFGGLISYMNLLISGDSKASTTGRPLGNKFFSGTLSKCLDTQTNSSVPRHLYFDYVPTGNISIPMSATEVSSINTGFKGLVPGLIEDLSEINPVSLLSTLYDDLTPKCTKVTLDTINQNNQLGAESHYITLTDQKVIDPCNYNTNINPVTNVKCKKPHNHVAPIIIAKESFENVTHIRTYYYIIFLISFGLFLITIKLFNKHF